MVVVLVVVVVVVAFEEHKLKWNECKKKRKGNEQAR